MPSGLVILGMGLYICERYQNNHEIHLSKIRKAEKQKRH